MDTPIISGSTSILPTATPRTVSPPATTKAPAPATNGNGADKAAAATAFDSKDPPQGTSDSGEVQGAAKQIEQFIHTVAQNLQFKIDDDSGQIVVRLVDNETQKVIRQIPSEEMLEIAKTLDKLKGLLISGKA